MVHCFSCGWTRFFDFLRAAIRKLEPVRKKGRWICRTDQRVPPRVWSPRPFLRSLSCRLDWGSLHATTCLVIQLASEGGSKCRFGHKKCRIIRSTVPHAWTIDHRKHYICTSYRYLFLKSLGLLTIMYLFLASELFT